MRNIDHCGDAYAFGERARDVFDPDNGGVQARVRLGSEADPQPAVDAANAALPSWAATNPQRRAG